MRNPDRIEPMLGLIRRIWLKNPDLRLGQLIANCVDMDYLYFVEDGELATSLQGIYLEAGGLSDHS